MTWKELKDSLKAYVDEISGDEPTDRDLEILGLLEDYAEPEGISEEEIAARINDAVAVSDAEWRKKFKDRFYGRDEESGEGPEEVTEPDVVENEPEEEELKSVLDYEW